MQIWTTQTTTSLTYKEGCVLIIETTNTVQVGSSFDISYIECGAIEDLESIAKLKLSYAQVKDFFQNSNNSIFMVSQSNRSEINFYVHLYSEGKKDRILKARFSSKESVKY